MEEREETQLKRAGESCSAVGLESWSLMRDDPLHST